jgi:hypothetical protein
MNQIQFEEHKPTMQERILKTLEDKMLIDRYYMEEEQVKDLEEQIKAVKEYIGGGK